MRDCARARSLSATTRRSGQIARSAVTSRSEIPFTVTYRSPSRARTNPFPAAQPPIAIPAASTITRTTDWFTNPPKGQVPGPSPSLKLRLDELPQLPGRHADYPGKPVQVAQPRAHVQLRQDHRELPGRRAHDAARVLRLGRVVCPRTGTGLRPSLDLRRTRA